MKELTFFRKFIQIMMEGSRLNWHERNSGNLTYRLNDEEKAECQKYLEETERIHDLLIAVPELNGDLFLVTGSGKFFMNAEFATDEVVGIIEVVNEGTQYRVRYGLSDNTAPTSELPSHLQIQEQFKKSGNDNRTVYHCHPTNVNALTYVYPQDSYEFSAKMWKMATECAVVAPRGVAVLEWMMPGSVEIGTKSAELVEEFDLVIWVHHGVFAVGDTLDNTFGLVHVIEKSAEIAYKLESMNRGVINTITKKNITDLAARFNVELNKKVVEKL